MILLLRSLLLLPCHRKVVDVLVKAGANLEAATTFGGYVGDVRVEAGATAIILAAAGGFE